MTTTFCHSHNKFSLVAAVAEGPEEVKIGEDSESGRAGKRGNNCLWRIEASRNPEHYHIA